LICLADDDVAKNYYDTLNPSNQSYFYRWIAQAKTYHTKADRIAKTLIALAKKQNYSEMIRELKSEKM
jgi:uncharacterized protein YdeI (YjbR/CyaY-like superfamily)